MRQIVIVCGMMGVGKTHFAKTYSKLFNAKYVNFDHTYHQLIQKSNNNKYKEYLNFLKKNLDNKSNYIIDGWFSWEREWYKHEFDTSFEELKSLFPKSKVDIVLLEESKELTIRRYYSKQSQDTQPDYEFTYDVRFENLLKKYNRCKEDKYGESQKTIINKRN